MAQPSETTGWNSSGSNRLEPSSGKKATGWIVDEKPASSYANWLFATIEAWLVWVQGILSSPNTWTGVNLFTGGVLQASAGVSSPAILASTTGFSAGHALQVASVGGADAVSVAVSGGTGAGIAVSVLGSGVGGLFAASAAAAMSLLGNVTHGPLFLQGLSADPSSNTEGEIYYNNVTHHLRVCTNSGWVTIV